jgi:hypothetical protein
MARKPITHDDSESDVVLKKMRETETPLTLKNYIDFAFLGDPPEGIEEDGEFLGSVPDVILNSGRRRR